MVMDSLAAYRRDMGPRQPLEPNEERRLIRQAQAGDRHALDRLFRAHAYYVIKIAAKFFYSGAPASDLVQAGNIGLMRAVQKFDHRRKTKLITYATQWIQQHMRILARNSECTIHRPSQFFTQRSRDKMISRLSRRQLKALVGTAGPLGRSVAETHVASASDEMEVTESREWLEHSISRLEPVLRETIEARLRGETLETIARRDGVSRQAVKQRETRAIGRLREMADHAARGPSSPRSNSLSAGQSRLAIEGSK